MSDLPAQPRVSVVMPAYNHAPYIRRAIESVLDQDYPNLELLVVDDGSRDGTWDVIQTVLAESGGRFRAFSQANCGVCKTINRAVKLSTGEFVALLASDDYYLPGKISAQVEMFRDASDKLALVHTSAYLDYQNGAPLEDLTGSYRPAVGLCFEQILTQAVRVVAPSIMFRRTVFDRLGGFDENLAAEDVDFFLRIAAEGSAFGYIDRPLMAKTVVEGSGGSQLRRLIRVHEQIAEKYRDRLSSREFERQYNLMHEHLIILAAGAGDYRLASEAALARVKAQHSFTPLWTLARWSARSAILGALPSSVRHRLRLFRAKVRS